MPGFVLLKPHDTHLRYTCTHEDKHKSSVQNSYVTFHHTGWLKEIQTMAFHLLYCILCPLKTRVVITAQVASVDTLKIS